ncbi:MAG: fimbria/pilus periplasmic chaperone [Rhodospirillaceae bacterium]
MNGNKRFSRLAALALTTGLTLASSAAFAFEVSPISQEFTPSGRGASQSFQLANDRDEQVTVTVAVTTRDVDLDGAETHNPTGAFSVFPTQVVIPARSTQIVRVRWMGDAAPKNELAYRLIAEETPLKTRRDTPGASIFMTVRYVGSLYVVPKTVSSDVKVVSARAVDNGAKLEVLLENRGTGHSMLEDPSLKVSAGGVTKDLNTAALQNTMAGQNILAQGQRRFLIDWPAGLPAGPVTAELRYTPQR